MTEGGEYILKQMFDDPAFVAAVDAVGRRPEIPAYSPDQQEIQRATVDAMVGMLSVTMDITGVHQDRRVQTLDPIVERMNGAGVVTPETFMEEMESSLLGIPNSKDRPEWTERGSFIAGSKEGYDVSNEYTAFTNALDLHPSDSSQTLSEYMGQFARSQNMTAEKEQLFRGYVAGRLMEELYVFGMSNVLGAVQQIKALASNPSVDQSGEARMRLETNLADSRMKLNAFNFSPLSRDNLQNARIGEGSTIRKDDFMSLRMHKFPPERNRLQEQISKFNVSMAQLNNRIQSHA